MIKSTLLAIIAVAALAGCAGKTTTIEAETPNGYRKVSDDRYQHNETTITTPAYNDCMSTNAPTLGTTGADMYCRGVTSGGTGGTGVPGMVPGAYGPTVVPGGGVVVPGPFSGYPGTAPIIVPGPGAISSAPAGGGVVVPGANQGAGIDAAAITRSEYNHECRIAALEGKPCPKAKK